MRFGRQLSWGAAIVVGTVVLLQAVVVDLWLVPGEDAVFLTSLKPTIGASDRVVLLRNATPRTGQLVRCPAPEAPGSYVVGRVFGVGGDTVEVTGMGEATVSGVGEVTRRGCPPQPVRHPLSGRDIMTNCAIRENGGWTYEVLISDALEPPKTTAIPEGSVYLLSDNRFLHQDSRDYGVLPIEGCEHIIFRLWGETFTDSSRRFNILW